MSTLYVVDGHSHIFRAYHAVGYLSTSKGVPSHAVLILSTMLWKLIREEQPDYLGIALDPKGPTFRDALFAEYKATRTAMPDDLARQLPYVRRLFEALRTPVVEVPGYEADDVLATLVEHALKLPDLDVTIVTGDKDLLQLVGPRVRVLSVLGRTGEKIVYDEAKVRERWGVGPEQIPEVMALMGDSIDNIPGVKGIGEKTAVKLIAQYGSVDKLYDNLTLIAGKLRETLALGRKQALLSRELALVNRHVPLDFDLERFRRGEPDWTRLRALWMEMEFTRLVKELPAPAPVADAGPVEILAEPAALGAWGARVPADAAVTLDWAGEARPRALAATVLGARAEGRRRARAHAHLRGDRAAARAGAGRDGAHRYPRRLGAARGVRQGARAQSRQPHARDLRAGRRGVHDRLAQAAQPHSVREAEAADLAPREDRAIDRRRPADPAGAGLRAARQDPRAPDPGQTQGA